MTPLLEQYAALALDKQTTLNRIADTTAAWRVDLETGILTLGGDTFTTRFLGSYAYQSSSWLWLWANQHLKMRADEADSACILREYAAAHPATANRSGSTPLFQHPADSTLLAQERFTFDAAELHNLAAVVCGLTGAYAYLSRRLRQRYRPARHPRPARCRRLAGRRHPGTHPQHHPADHQPL